MWGAARSLVNTTGSESESYVFHLTGCEAAERMIEPYFLA
jgi:hypothetical protein